MPPLGNPSAMSYSRSSARSDLKAFTSPMASYNFRMRAICDVSDMRTFLRLMLMAHSSLRLMLMAHSRATPLLIGVTRGRNRFERLFFWLRTWCSSEGFSQGWAAERPSVRRACLYPNGKYPLRPLLAYLALLTKW